MHSLHVHFGPFGKQVNSSKVHIQIRRWSPISIYAERLCMLDILSAPLLEIATHTTSSDCIDMQIHASAKISYSLMYLL